MTNSTFGRRENLKDIHNRSKSACSNKIRKSMTATVLNRQLDADMTLLDHILIEDATSGSANARNPF